AGHHYILLKKRYIWQKKSSWMIYLQLPKNLSYCRIKSELLHISYFKEIAIIYFGYKLWWKQSLSRFHLLPPFVYKK
ncbi:hypothetical protein, partial [Chitinophaga eiseniae]|uniref:hypothetical protein n=1 Tax=Chitinophaga eiseniae TaxID=634771 RepID=UPI001B3B1C70